MRPLSGERLLLAWELGSPESYLGRITTLLAIARPELSRDKIAAQSLHSITADLLRLRSVSFGPTLEGFLLCPTCSARLEFSFPVAPILDRLQQSLSSAAGPAPLPGTPFRLRPATLADLEAASASPDLDSARRDLLFACLEPIDANPEANHPQLDSRDLEQRALDLFDRISSDSEILVDLRCAECDRAHAVDLDLGRFLWSEVRHAAVRLMREVHELARAYGWQESAILAMSPLRRDAYLEMAL